MGKKLELMTKGVMLKKLEAREDPIDLSIEKWRAVILKKHWEKVCSNETYITASTCALCYEHHTGITCGKCPLKSRGSSKGCTHRGAQWMRAYDALMDEDYKRFRKYGLLIIARLERAQKARDNAAKSTH